MGMRTCSKSFLLALSLIVLAAGPAAAQVKLFQPWPEVVWSRYSHPGMCASGIFREKVGSRFEDRVFRESGVVLDTLADRAPKELEELTEHVRETARVCITAAMPDSIVDRNREGVIKLLYDAGLNDRAMEILRQQLAKVDVEGDRGVLAAVDTVLKVYGWVVPRPFELLKLIEEEYLPRVEEGTAVRVQLYGRLLGAVQVVRGGAHLDSARADVYRARLKEAVASLEGKERDEFYKVLAGGRFSRTFDPEKDDLAEFVDRFFQVWVEDMEAVDSLRQSTDAYVRHKKRIFEQVHKVSQEKNVWGPIGERLPEIVAEHWRGCEDPCGPRPAPGRVTLFLPLTLRFGGNFQSDFVALRRLEQQFPDLETIVFRVTQGYVGTLKEVLTAEREADIVKKWMDSHGVRATLAMAEERSFYLPEPDGRKIIQPSVTETRLDAFFKKHYQAILVDKEGRFVHTERLDVDRVDHFAQLIRALLEQETPGT